MEVSFSEMLEDAKKRNYAVGYFESWNLESLLAVCDAAEKMKSPVIIGFGGLFLTNEKRAVEDKLNIYASLAREACKSIAIPACTIFNESRDFNSVLESVDHGYDVVMFVDSGLTVDELTIKVSKIVEKAHKSLVAVEAEIDELPGLDMLTGNVIESKLTDPEIAKRFASKTKIDSLSINVGQSHSQGKKVELDFNRLKEIREATDVHLVLHGGSNMSNGDIGKAIDLGVTKFNLGGILKKRYFTALRNAIGDLKDDCNVYEVIGSGFKEDILIKSRMEVQRTVEKYMQLYRSAGKA